MFSVKMRLAYIAVGLQMIVCYQGLVQGTEHGHTECFEVDGFIYSHRTLDAAEYGCLENKEKRELNTSMPCDCAAFAHSHNMNTFRLEDDHCEAFRPPILHGDHAGAERTEDHVDVYSADEPFAPEGGNHHWGYADPAGWATHFPNFCAGTAQSPVDLTSVDMTFKSLPAFSFVNYDAVPPMQLLINNGHSVSVSSGSESVPTLSGGGLDGDYSFHSHHFHWGSDDAQGSEHTLDGEYYPMEMHMIHYKTEYGGVAEAVNHADGLAVLGTWINVEGDDNPNFAPIVDTIRPSSSSARSASLCPPKPSPIANAYAFNTVLPTNVDNFYRYNGSLTTPTCNEAVIWTVFSNTLSISQAQMDVFRALKNDEDGNMADNYRPVQPLNGRTVWTSFNPK